MPRERILLIRSGRHLVTATDALRARFAGCDIAVVGTPGTEQVIGHAGIAPEDVFIYRARPRFTPVAFNVSLTALATRRWGFTRVAILWNDPDGCGQGNVDRTAFGLAPRGFLAITPDGSIVERTLYPQLGHEVKRTLVSLAAGVVLGALFVPAFAIAAVLRLVNRGLVGRVPRSGPAVITSDASAGPLRGTRPTYVIARESTDKAA